MSSPAEEGGGERRPVYKQGRTVVPSACLSISAHTPPNAYYTATMAFAGKWETESQEGYDAFCKLLGETDGM